MKKGLCILLSAMMLAISFTACSDKGEKDAEVTTMVNSDGSVYVFVTDKNGEKVTEADGKEVTSILSEEEVSKLEKKAGKTEKGTSKTDKESGKSEENSSTSQTKKDKTASDMPQINQDIVNSVTGNEDFEMTAAEKDLLPEGTTLAKKTTLFEDKVQKVIKTGKFTIKMNVKSGNSKMPMTVSFDKDKMYASFEMSGMKAGLLYMDDTAYLLFPNLFVGSKVYMEYPDADSGMDDIFDSFGKLSDANGTYVGSSKVKVGSAEYTCEEYKNKDGAVTKYYFDSNKEWKIYECLNGEGENMAYEIESFSNKADSSLFSLKGYRKMDENTMARLLGGVS